MDVQDAQRWAQHLSDIRGDGEAGQRFQAFYEFWFDCAEKLLWEGTGGQPIGADPIPNLPVVEAVREALEITECTEGFGFLDIDLIGQMLCVASMHWASGPAMVEGLTFIEQRVMGESLARKIATLQQQASSFDRTL